MDVLVKICGLTNYEDAALAVKLGADYLGFIFAPSPRQIDAEGVTAILHELKVSGLRDKVKTVGVFVNEKNEIIERVIETTGINIVQLHGDETCEETKSYSFPWYKALRIASKEDVGKQIFSNNCAWNCSRLLIDSKVEGLYGGTGKSVTADVALYAKEKIKEAGKDFFLAGGVTPENVFNILDSIKPDGIDVGSGIEETKGKKSSEKMEKLFEEIREYKK